MSKGVATLGAIGVFIFLLFGGVAAFLAIAWPLILAAVGLLLCGMALAIDGRT